MKLYLSSYDFGNNPEQLRELFGDSVEVALISSALDFSTDIERLKESEKKELDGLRKIGLNPAVLDLRDYFGKQSELEKEIDKYDGVWVRGGNTFILRKAFAQSGFDQILQKKKNADFVYAGYSAGTCVLGPSLKGIHLADKPDQNANGYHEEIIWEGLGVMPYHVVPHYRSNHPESEMMEDVVKYYQEHGMEYRTLKDGEVIIEEV